MSVDGSLGDGGEEGRISDDSSAFEDGDGSPGVASDAISLVGSRMPQFRSGRLQQKCKLLFRHSPSPSKLRRKRNDRWLSLTVLRSRIIVEGNVVISEHIPVL